MNRTENIFYPCIKMSCTKHLNKHNIYVLRLNLCTNNRANHPFLPISLFYSSTNYPNCIPMQTFTLPKEDLCLSFQETKNAFYNFKSNWMCFWLTYTKYPTSIFIWSVKHWLYMQIILKHLFHQIWVNLANENLIRLVKALQSAYLSLYKTFSYKTFYLIYKTYSYYFLKDLIFT